MRDRRSLGLGLALVLVAVVGTLGDTRTGRAQGSFQDPAASLVGQRVTACNYGADLEIAVAQAVWTRAVVGETAPGAGMWIVILIDVTNVSDKAEALTTRPLHVRDGQGRAYEVQEDPPDATEVARAYGVTPPWQEFEPGVTARSLVTFLVPEDVGPLTLAGKRDYC